MSKRIKFQFQGSTYDVQVERRGDSLILTRDGNTYQVDLIDESRTISNEHVSAVPRSVGSSISPTPRPPRPSAPKAAATSGRPAAPTVSAEPAGEGDERAPITGTIKDIRVSQGDKVEAGQLIMMMEAMKMDIEVFAEKSGTVKAILVNLGDSVKEKQALITLG